MTEQEQVKTKMVLDNIYFHLTKDDFPFSLNDLEYKNFLEVMSLFKDINKNNKDEIKKLIKESESLFLKKEYSLCLTLLNRLIKIDPYEWRHYFNVSHAFVKEKKYKEAVEYLTKSIYFNPNNSKLYSFRGQINRVINNYPQCINDLTKAIELNPNDSHLYKYRRLCYVDIMESKLAEADYLMEKKLLEFEKVKTNA